MNVQTTLAEKPTDEADDRQSGTDDDRTDLLTATEPTTYRCTCDFEGCFWEFDHVNPIQERYRRKEQAAADAGDWQAERSARKNRINARYRDAKACPVCGRFGDEIVAVDPEESCR